MEPKYLMILEVSQKQAYIFGSRKLRDNLTRSQQIEKVTDPAYFAKSFSSVYKEENLVYSGGGHTVLQFETREAATRFAQALSFEVLRKYPEIELFIKVEPYDPGNSPGENLKALTYALEHKKSRRQASFYRRSFGFEAPPKPDEKKSSSADEPELYGWKLTTDGEELAGEDNLLAVVHIDGNSMGRRVDRIYEKAQGDWEECKKLLRAFSDDVTAHFDQAYQDMCTELAGKLKGLGWDPKKHRFPIRKVIAAGDDICFVAAGSLGLACAVSFIRYLRGKTNSADGEGYAACAGVCMVHKKYPFRAAYEMSEKLCKNAKRFGANYDPEGGVCAVDWHIEFGQLKDSLDEIRADYVTDDGGRLELRPYALDENPELIPPLRHFAYFTTVYNQLKTKSEELPRSKVTPLREAFKQGELESKLALRQANLEHILDLGVEARCPDWLKETLRNGSIRKEAFITDRDKRRCLYFDAIELVDHVILWEEGDE